MKPKQPKPIFAPRQQEAIDIALRGDNLLITGPAGTGKSFLQSHLKSLIPRLAMTASTGIAGINIGASTIHSWTGVGLAIQPAEVLAKKILASEARYNDPTARRIRNLKTMGIDEISMIEGRFLDKIGDVFQIIRKDDSPFGGVQILAFGDFLQLPPVSKNDRPRFAFESFHWKNANFSTIVLDKVFRQEDQAFASVLGKIRIGHIDSEVTDFINSRKGTTPEDLPVKPLIVHTHNKGADSKNKLEFEKLPGKPLEFKAKDWADGDSDYTLQQLDRNCILPKHLLVKENTQVMLLHNDGPYANGSMGTLTDMMTGMCIVEFSRGEWEVEQITRELYKGEDLVATRTQMPLRHAWAITIHKSQGMTLDAIEVHLSQAFAHGQAYVALSRAKTAEGLFIASGSAASIKANPLALRYYGIEESN